MFSAECFIIIRCPSMPQLMLFDLKYIISDISKSFRSLWITSCMKYFSILKHLLRLSSGSSNLVLNLCNEFYFSYAFNVLNFYSFPFKIQIFLIIFFVFWDIVLLVSFSSFSINFCHSLIIFMWVDLLTLFHKFSFLCYRVFD